MAAATREEERGDCAEDGDEAELLAAPREAFLHPQPVAKCPSSAITVDMKNDSLYRSKGDAEDPLLGVAVQSHTAWRL